MRCPLCEASNRPERRFCHACAAPLSVEPCPACGFENFPSERFCGGCAEEVGATAVGVAERGAPRLGAAMDRPATALDASADAERRQLTVMFCDMVGSTAMSAALDAEDLRAVISRFQDACAGAVARFGGFVARYMGDGMLVYFGYPRAYEDNAERAVRAGLAIVDAVRALGEHGARPRVRVGIATGPVVVGDIIGEGSSAERAVVGETPNLAARLQGLAEPDTVVVSPRTRRLGGPSFAYEDLGAHALKGFPAPIRAHRVLEEQRSPARRAGTGVGPLVGRRAESALLEGRFAQLLDGEGAVVVVTGAAGSGKTQLIDAFASGIGAGSASPVPVIFHGGARHASDAVLLPVLEHLLEAAGIELGDPAATRRERLDRFARVWSEEPEKDALWLRRAIGVDPPGEGAPAESRRQMLAVLFRYYLGGDGPRILVFEDLQWADATTLELVHGLVERAGQHPVLLLLSHRAGFDPPWREVAGLTQISLGRLTDAAARELVAASAAEPLPERSVDEIVERADGVPGFLVELTRALKGTPGVGEPGAHIPVPETLLDSLTAQLDRIGSARAVAQAAAVIGRRFSRELLERCVRLSPSELERELKVLVDAGLIAPPRGLSDAYAFRHGLMREVAYESLLRSDQRAQHDRVATVLLDELTAAAEAEPTATAHHLEGAGRAREAAAWWSEAATRAGSQASFVESASHLRRAVACLTPVTDPDDPADARALACALVELAQRLRLVGGIEEAFESLDRAERLIEPHDLPETLSHVYFCRGNLYFMNGTSEECAAAHRRAHELAERSGSAEAQARALGGMADAAMLAGDRLTAGQLGERCVETSLRHGLEPIAAAHAAVSALGYYWALRSDDAIRLARLGATLGAKVGLPRTVSLCLSTVAIALADQGRADEALATLEEARVSKVAAAGGSHLWPIDHIVCRAAGMRPEAHAMIARALGDARDGLLWPVNASCLVGECPKEELPTLLEAIYEGVGRLTPNFVGWTVMCLVDGLLHRGAWPELAEAVARVERVATVEGSPRMRLFVDASRVAHRWSQDPGDPAAVAAMEALVERATAGDVATLAASVRHWLDRSPVDRRAVAE